MKPRPHWNAHAQRDFCERLFGLSAPKHKSSVQNIQPSVAHQASHASQLSSSLHPAVNDLIRVGTRRWLLQTGLAGLGGLTLPDLLQLRAEAGPTAPSEKKAVILFWLSGGPSQIDTWDPKPDAPREFRSPFGTMATKVPGVFFTEHLPLQASIADQLSVLRSVDCGVSNHTPITMQSGNPLAVRTDDGKDGGGYPCMGSVAAKFRGPNSPNLPAFVGLADKWKSDVWGAGHMGVNYQPVQGQELAGKFALPRGIDVPRMRDRMDLRRRLDGFRRDLDQGNTLERVDRYTQEAYDMVLSGKVQKAFNLEHESEQTRDAYGRVSVGAKALLARRLVEAGVTFVLVSGAWGYFDHHGDDAPPWGGIITGLKPILPTIDRALYALITDLEQRGLLESTLVLMLGEFGRSPRITIDCGREHWTPVMSMLVAGGGLRHGQAVGSTDSRGAEITSGMVRPQDLAATVFQHLGIDLSSHWTSPRGRPTPIVTEGGRPIPELT